MIWFQPNHSLRNCGNEALDVSTDLVNDMKLIHSRVRVCVTSKRWALAFSIRPRTLLVVAVPVTVDDKYLSCCVRTFCYTVSLGFQSSSQHPRHRRLFSLLYLLFFRRWQEKGRDKKKQVASDTFSARWLGHTHTHTVRRLALTLPYLFFFLKD